MPNIPKISIEDQQAIYRLTEQADILLKKAQALPKGKILAQKAQEISEDIRRILHNTDDVTVCDLFEVVIAPRLVRLAQELKLQRNLKTRYKVATSYLPPAMASKPAVQTKSNTVHPAERVKSILSDLADMLK